MNVRDALQDRSAYPLDPSVQSTNKSLPQTGDLLSQVGNTPLIDLSSFSHGLGVSSKVGVYAKAEWWNPSGSVKARAAL